MEWKQRHGTHHNAGESRSLAMQALQAAEKECADVDRLMQDAADAAKRAHDVQTMLIVWMRAVAKYRLILFWYMPRII
ncbi:PTS system cellobiose-specific transporter subunit IIA [Klebsiella pneumoniae]|nr:PTS system cellobiose-specific transporter subunit IIA [Klebsiella pneumoniae]